jgi:hypothetical protein
MIQNLVHVGDLVRDACDTEHRFLPQVLVADFSYRDVELIPQAILQAQQDLAFVLEGVAVRDKQLNCAKPDDHSRGHEAGDDERTGSKFGRHLVEYIRFNDVAGLEVVEVLDSDTALVSLLDLPHVVFEPSQ